MLPTSFPPLLSFSPSSVILNEVKKLAFRLHGHAVGGVGSRVASELFSPHPGPLPQGEREHAPDVLSASPVLLAFLCHSERSEEAGFSFAWACRRGCGIADRERAFFSPHPGTLPQGEREHASLCPSRETCPRHLLSGSGNPGMMPGMFMACLPPFRPPSSFRPPPPFSLLCHSERSEESGFPLARACRRGRGPAGRVRTFFSFTPPPPPQGEREPRDFAQRLDPPGLAVVARGCFPSPPASVADVLLKPFISVRPPRGCLDADYRRLVHPRQNAYVHQDRHHHPGNIPARAGHDSRKITKRALPHGS